MEEILWWVILTSQRIAKSREYPYAQLAGYMEGDTTRKKISTAISWLRMKSLGIFLLLGVALVVFSPVLFGGMIASSNESVGGYYPYAIFYGKAIAEHTSFLWNPYYYAGFPTALNQFIGYLSPLSFVSFSFLSPLKAYHVLEFLVFFAGLSFSYLFGRAQTLTRAASVILALTYALGQTFSSYFVGISYGVSFAVLPLILYALKKVSDTESLRPRVFFTLLSGGALGIAFLSGFPQTTFYGIVFTLCYALFLDLQKGLSFSLRSFPAVFSLFFALVIAVAISFPQLAAMFEYIPYSVRTANYTAGANHLPLLNLLSIVIPYYVNIPGYIGGFAGLYFGVTALFFFLSTLFFSRTRTTVFFLGSYVVMIGFASALPILSVVNEYLPILSRFGTVGRWLYVAALPFAFVAAYGFDHFRMHAQEMFQSKKFRTFLWVVSILVLSATIALLALGEVFRRILSDEGLRERMLTLLLGERTLTYGMPYYSAIFSKYLTSAYAYVAVTNENFLLLLASQGATVLALWSFVKKKIPQTIFSLWILILVIGNVFIAYREEMLRQDAFVPDQLLTTPPESARTILSREEPGALFRVIPFLYSEGVRQGTLEQSQTAAEAVLRARNFLVDGVGGIYGVSSIGGFEAFRPLRHNQLIDTVLRSGDAAIFDVAAVEGGVVLDQHYNAAALRTVSTDEKISSFLAQLDLLQMMNVKYILSAYPLKSDGLLAIPLHENQGVSAYLYEVLGTLPRIYAPSRVRIWTGSNTELLLAMSLPHNFRAEAFIECDDCKDGGEESESSVVLEKYGNGYISAKVMEEKGGWVVFSESSLPGWEAFVDGKRVPIRTANYVFQAVFVEKGTHRVEFSYKP